ncbi:MAG TPA: hypothetical protein VKB80_36465 [Kofleriaceae bacterium]|nr:hypothetical protein [Kofleriaceae bacterium]
MSPALAGDEWREEDRQRHLDDEHDGRNLRDGPALQRGHLAEQREQRGQAGRERPHDGDHPGVGADRVGDELRRQAAPRERRPGRERGRDAADRAPAPDGVGNQREGAHADQRRGEPGAAGMVRGLGRRDDREPGDPADDRDDRRDVAPADALVQRACAEHEQQDQAEGEPGLDDGQRGQEQRGRLQRPAEQADPGTGKPPRAPRQIAEQRRLQGLLGGHAARLHRLQRDAEVVEAGRGARGDRTEGDRGHGLAPR